jgi:hypothetical protein
MRTLKVVVSVLATLVLLCAGVFAKHAPLPSELMQAKSVYVLNAAASRKDARECAEELSTWGRFKLVTDPKDADVIFRLSSGIANGGIRVTNTSVSSRSYYMVTIYVLQRASGNVLWSDSRAQQLFSSAAKSVVKELRKRVAEQDKAEGKAN